MSKNPDPGVSRENRITKEGLVRLEKHLKMGAKISRPVLQQWIRRYGKDVQELLQQYEYPTGD